MKRNAVNRPRASPDISQAGLKIRFFDDESMNPGVKRQK
jgi:hypothetical protein